MQAFEYPRKGPTSPGLPITLGLDYTQTFSETLVYGGDTRIQKKWTELINPCLPCPALPTSPKQNYDTNTAVYLIHAYINNS